MTTTYCTYYQGIVWGLGDSEDAAWSDAQEYLVEDNDEQPVHRDEQGLFIGPCSAALADDVLDHGAKYNHYSMSNGVLCLRSEIGN